MIKKLCPLMLSLFLVISGCGELMEDEDGDSTHNAGQNCKQSGCHGFTYAGTVYTSRTGETAAANVTVKIFDSTGTITMTTNSAGNFYTSQGNPSGGYTASVTLNEEVTKFFSRTDGGCNQSGCHVASSEQGRIYAQ